MAAHVVFNDDGQMMLPCFIAIAGVLYGLFAITTLHLSVTRVWLGVSTILNFIYIDVPFLFSINEGINTPVTAYSIPGTTTNKKFTTIGTSAKPVFAFNTGIIPEIQATIKQSVVKKMMKALYCPFSAGLLTINVSGPFWMKEMANIVAFFQLVITLNIFTSPMNEYLDTKYKIHGSRFAILNLTFRIGVRGLKATMQGFTEKIVQMMKNKKLFASQDGPDILSQIENEYGRESKAYSAAGHSYINRATTQAIELDTEVPWVRCKADDASDTIVRVSRSWTAIHAKHKYVLHKDYIFIDAKGKDIWGQIPEVLISKFQNLLEDQKVYTIQNFKVMNAPSQFHPISNRYVIEFTASTTVEEVDNMSAIPEYKFVFIRESEIPTNLHNRLLLFGKLVLSTSSAIGFYANPKIPQIIEFQNRDTDSNLTTPIYYDPSDITKSPLVTLEQLNAALTETQNQEHVTTLGVSPKSPKSCVSALHSATPQSSKQAANSKDKFKVAAIQFNEDDQDELSDDVPLATMRKRLKRRRCQISDDE
ncbi:Proline transporter 2 [Linum perenne]